MADLSPANRTTAGAGLKNTARPYWLIPIGLISTRAKFRDVIMLQTGVMAVYSPANRKAGGVAPVIPAHSYWPSKTRSV